MRFLKASGKHDIHHSLYHTSSSSSKTYPSFVKCFRVGSGGVPDMSEGGDLVGVDLLDDDGEGE